MRRYVLYCDESEDAGQFFGNFYGGALVQGEHLLRVEKRLLEQADELGLTSEIKWSKTSTANYDRYIRLMETFFDLIRADLIKVRIMFTQNAHEAQNLTSEQRRNTYFILYYHFLKSAFGLEYSNPTSENVALQILFDELPAKEENRQQFKIHIANLQTKPEFRVAKIKIRLDDLQEVDSHHHVVLQCLDVVLGSMNFRLNDLHKKKPEGFHRRGKKTIVKEKLYRYINSRTREMRRGFNIGSSTGTDGDIANHWRHPYRHWLFVPRDAVFKPAKTKRKGSAASTPKEQPQVGT